jgi:hypothetical protein
MNVSACVTSGSARAEVTLVALGPVVGETIAFARPSATE